MEFKMEPERTHEVGGSKKKLKVKVLENNLVDLRELGKKLRAVQRTIFRSRYGNLLGLLEVQVQITVITALVQYFDHLLRCFTFCDFQLVPTFEEYAQIFDMPIDKVIPYQHLDQPLSMSTLSTIMRLPARDLEDRFIFEDRKRFSLSFLAEYLHQLSEERDWEVFMDVFALTLFGIMLFPKIERFVDNATINVFIAYRTQCESPDTAILADTYLALNSCNPKKKDSDGMLFTYFVCLASFAF